MNDTVTRRTITRTNSKSHNYRTDSDQVVKELHESIRYALRIQRGMMLKEKHLQRIFPESFIFFKPRDLVSGDFYWFNKVGGKTIIALADCTGHGIPGALLTVLGINILNQIILEEGMNDASAILSRLDHKIKKAFSYSSDFDNESTSDGMDISLCVIEKDTINFSGARRPVLLVKNDQVREFRGARYPVGGLQSEIREYPNTIIPYEPGEMLYLYSDGFADQFGGPLDRKFMITSFKQCLKGISNCSAKVQCGILNQKLDSWKENTPQTDDISVLGVRL